MASKGKCMRCGEKPGTINNLCLTCDELWREAKREYKILTGLEAGEEQLAVWVLQPNRWDETKKQH